MPTAAPAAFEALAMAANPAVPAMSANALVEHFCPSVRGGHLLRRRLQAEADSYLRQVTEIGVVLPQVVSGNGRVAVTPLFATPRGRSPHGAGRPRAARASGK